MALDLTVKALIVADDLSGAADGAAVFAAVGMEAAVLLDPRAVPDTALDAPVDVVAVDLDSRRLPADPAAALNAEAVRRLHAPGGILVKMMDAALRGNWAAETVAARRAAAPDGQPPPLAVVAPACPALGVASGPAIPDPAAPDPAEVAAALRAAGMRAEAAGTDMLRGGADSLAHALAAWIGEGVEAVACGAATDDDLAMIAEVTAVMRDRLFWVGSVGLARHLSAVLGLAHAPAIPGAPLPTPLDPVLAVVGSLSPMARAQAAALAGVNGVRALTVDPVTLRIGPGTAAWGHAERDLREALSSGDDVLLNVGPGAAPDPHEAHDLAVALGRLISEQAPRVGGLILTGDETARAVLAALGVGAFRLLGEVESGVPLGLSEGARILPLVTKGGGHGDERTLVRCRERLRAQALPPVPEAGTGT
ncbi:MAG TPA: four-carbon acid sugar kinase family protein [Azospirillum sp.]|nr:four-carbon acid sugar kinase family protein [Azospirillum sp.]